MRIARVTVIVLALLSVWGSTSALATAPNTGAIGSRCKPSHVRGATDPALDMTSLGRLPARYEIGRPAGAVRRVMLLIHGGGWYRVGQGALNVEHGAAAQWRRVGWETVNVDYRGCGRSLGDVVRIYDRVRATVGAAVPVCVQGESAGGHLALMLAVRRPAVACVVAYAAPTDLWTGTRYVLGMARAAFGRAGLKKLSPASNATRLKARVLLATATDDTLIPESQGRELADRVHAVAPDAYVDVAAVAPGPVGFVHGSASPAALDDVQARLAQLVAPFGAAPVQPPRPPFVPSRLRPPPGG